MDACPGCGVQLPRIEAPLHRYIGASAACWALFTNLVNGGEPPMAPAATNALLVDAYAAQHPGTPSPQSIQSVAVHLLSLFSFFERGTDAGYALQVRQRALREQFGPKHSRFEWLDPPDLHGAITVAGIAQQPDAESRTSMAAGYVESVWQLWSEAHKPTIAAWYESFVIPD